MHPANRSHKQYSRGYEYESTIKNTAEIVKIEGEDVLVDKRTDIVARINGHRGMKEIGEWVADWAGCDGIKGFGIHGPTRDDVIAKMRTMIRRKMEFRDLCADIWKKRYGK